MERRRVEQKALSAKEFWDRRHAETGGKRTYPCPRRSLLDWELDLVFRRHLAGPEGRQILEVGCGSSVWLPYFRKELGWRVSGIDYSEIGLRRAREILDVNGAEAQLVLGDFWHMPDAFRGRFDAVFSLGVIEHFSDPAAALKALGETLRPGGLIITWVPNTSGWALRLSRRLNKSLRDAYVDLDREKLRGFHESAGLKVREGKYVQFLDLSHIRVTKPAVLRRGFYRLAGLMARPIILAQRLLQISIPAKKLSSGIIVVARKT